MNTITLSEPTFARLETKARESSKTPDELADELLRQALSPLHPYIEIREKHMGPRAFIKDTRVSVSNIVAYTRLGETPESMTTEIMPHLTLAQVYDALSYYHDHREEIEEELKRNTPESTEKYFRERLGEEGYRKITGQST